MRNEKFKKELRLATSYFEGMKGVQVVEPKGAFYLTVYFPDGILNERMFLKIDNEKVKEYVDPLLLKAKVDRKLVLYLLASTGICVVPLSSFCCEKSGFRVTLLEENPEKFNWIFKTLRDQISLYLESV
jgi:alanine-synthesizing transaminase